MDSQEAVLDAKILDAQLAHEGQQFSQAIADKQPGMRAYLSNKRIITKSTVLVGAKFDCKPVVVCQMADHFARAKEYIRKYNEVG